MKICIYGAGAIGGLLGGHLARAGEEVSLIARGAHLDALRSDGLTVETAADGGRFTVRPACAADPAALGVQDVVVVAVKGPALASVASGIAPLLGPDTVVVTAMNGIPWWFFDGFPAAGPRIDLPALDPGGVVSCAIATRRVVGCVVHMGAAVPEPGVVRHMGGGLLIFGAASGQSTGRAAGKDDGRAARIARLFAPTPLEGRVTGNLRQEIWLKLLGNFNFAPVSALTGATNGAIGADPGLRSICADMFEEAAEAGRRIGLDPGMTAAERIDLGAALGDFRTSMLQDFDRGRPPELDAIVGVVPAIGRAVGAPTPLTDAVLALAAAKARGMGLG